MRIGLSTAALVVVRIFSGIFFALLVGCATAPPPVLPEVAKPTVTTVKEIVTRPCVASVPAAPAWATESLSANANEFERAKALLIEREQRRQYVPTLEAILQACR